MNRRRVLQVVGGLAATGAVGTAFAASRAPLRGTIDAKSVTGRRDETTEGIVLAHTDHLGIENERYAGAFESRGRVVVDEELAARLRRDYLDLHYHLHVVHRTANPEFDVGAGEALAYRVDRETFNAPQVGATVRFGSTGDAVPHIESLSVTDDTPD